MNKRSKSERNLQLEQENQDLKNRIQRSKPILLTIYDKVKLKEKFLHSKIDRDRRIITQYKNVAKDFKKLYEESLQIMHRGNFFNKFNDTSSNFIRNKPHKDGLQKYKSKSVYQQYKQRIENKITKQREDKNPEIEVLKKQNEELKNTMKEGINKLRMVRLKSEKSLKKTKSSNIIKPNLFRKQAVDQIQFKRKLIQRQRQRLSRIS